MAVPVPENMDQTGDRPDFHVRNFFKSTILGRRVYLITLSISRLYSIGE
jgi:hypothetical protein